MLLSQDLLAASKLWYPLDYRYPLQSLSSSSHGRLGVIISLAQFSITWEETPNKKMSRLGCPVACLCGIVLTTLMGVRPAHSGQHLPWLWVLDCLSIEGRLSISKLDRIHFFLLLTMGVISGFKLTSLPGQPVTWNCEANTPFLSYSCFCQVSYYRSRNETRASVPHHHTSISLCCSVTRLRKSSKPSMSLF